MKNRTFLEHSHSVRRRTLLVLMAAAAVAVHAPASLAQTYPSKPIRIVVNSASAGLTDLVARLIAPKLSTALGQPVLVENRPGGSGLVGAEAVAKAEPDGYTLGLVASAITVAPALVPSTRFDVEKDLTPVALLMTSPLILVTSANSPYKSVQQLVVEAKAKPGQIAVASGGSGTMTHLIEELFQVNAGIQLIHVPYKGGGPALNDVLAGQVPIYFDTLNTSTPFVLQGQLRALAIVADKRSAALPNVPTMAEAGYPGVQGSGWFALFAPANTPASVVARLNTEVNKALAAPDVHARIISMGGTVEGGPPKALSDRAQQETPRWTKLIKDRGITMQ